MNTLLLFVLFSFSSAFAAEINLKCMHAKGLKTESSDQVFISMNDKDLEAKVFYQAGLVFQTLVKESRIVEGDIKGVEFSNKEFSLIILNQKDILGFRRGTFKALINNDQWEFPIRCTGNL